MDMVNKGLKKLKVLHQDKTVDYQKMLNNQILNQLPMKKMMLSAFPIIVFGYDVFSIPSLIEEWWSNDGMISKMKEILNHSIPDDGFRAEDIEKEDENIDPEGLKAETKIEAEIDRKSDGMSTRTKILYATAFALSAVVISYVIYEIIKGKE